MGETTSRIHTQPQSSAYAASGQIRTATTASIGRFQDHGRERALTVGLPKAFGLLTWEGSAMCCLRVLAPTIGLRDPVLTQVNAAAVPISSLTAC